MHELWGYNACLNYTSSTGRLDIHWMSSMTKSSTTCCAWTALLEQLLDCSLEAVVSNSVATNSIRLSLWSLIWASSKSCGVVSMHACNYTLNHSNTSKQNQSNIAYDGITLGFTPDGALSVSRGRISVSTSDTPVEKNFFPRPIKYPTQLPALLCSLTILMYSDNVIESCGNLKGIIIHLDAYLWEVKFVKINWIVHN